ncbi:MAG: threonine/serine dehydratase [SAR324 cluster bacterium]|nr:threonine/serine dehydratase [SAR324 cluster bacterium]
MTQIKKFPDELSLESIRETSARIQPFIKKTPMFHYTEQGKDWQLKFEFLQRSGSFKARGALNNILQLDSFRREGGITAVSAGNHALAVAYASRSVDVDAKVVMQSTASPFRVSRAREYGAEVVISARIDSAFEEMFRIAETEERAIIHPFEGFHTIQGTATLGLEIVEQSKTFDVLLVAVGGGGLISGVGAAVKQLRPEVEIIGVEPEGAMGMTDSLEKGVALEKVDVDTIADSLGAPLHAPISFSVCQKVIDRTVLVSDNAMCQAMAWAADELKLALEPAGAAVLAALHGPLRKDCANRSVAAILCGSNIDSESWSAYVARGRKS